MLNITCMSLLKNKCLIKDGWYQAQNQDEIKVHNPFSGAQLGCVPNLTNADVGAAIEYAQTAQSAWAALTADKRSQILQKWATLIEEHVHDLATIMTTEQGKPLAEAIGEVRYANSFITWFAEEGKRVYGDVIPTKAPDLRYVVIKQPVGVCAAITPWNFPAAMMTRKVAPALAAGCSIIVKPASETPLTALALGELALQAGLPYGVLQIITGDAQRLGSQLSASPVVQKLSFTGSTDVGRKLMQQCAPTLKKLSLELGGNAPFIVFADADIKAAVTGLIASKYRNAGQTCICANRIYVQESIAETFISQFKAQVSALKVGNGVEEGTDIGPLINQAALEKTQALVLDAVQKGGRCIIGGQPHQSSDLAFEPTIITQVNADMRLVQEEIFAPVTPIITFTHEQEVITAANASEYGLAAYFYTQDSARSWRMMEQLQYGMVGHNTGLISNEVAPFGGIKQSGFGREGSKYGIDEYLNIKYWCTKV